MLNKLTQTKQGEKMKIINRPNMSVKDMIILSMSYESNKKTHNKQKLAKSCYEFINQYINNEINGKARLQPLNGYFYKHMKYQQNIQFNNNTNSKDINKFIDWIKKFTLNKVKVVTEYNNSEVNLNIYYK